MSNYPELYPKNYKVSDTSLDTRHYYIECDVELSYDEVVEAIPFSTNNVNNKAKFKLSTGAQGWISCEDKEYGNGLVEFEDVSDE